MTENLNLTINICKEFTESTFEKIDIEKYLDEQERTTLMLLLGKIM